MTQQEWEGRRVVLALHKARNVGVKATAEGGWLPAPGSQAYANLFIPMRYIQGRIQLSSQVMKAARSNKGSFARAMESEQKLLVEDIARQRNRILAGYGAGTLAVIATGANSTTQTVTKAGGITVTGDPNPTRFLKVGMVIATTTTSGPTITDLNTISAVGTNTITVGSMNTVTNDVVTLGASFSSTNNDSYNLEPMGILGMADSTTYVSSIHGLDRSSAANAFFRSQILSSVGALSADILQRGIDNTEEVSGEVIDQFVCHQSVRREVLKLAEADRRYFGGSDPRNFDVGTEAGRFKQDISFNGIPFRVDKDFAYATIVGLNKSHLYWYPETEGEWAKEDGDVLFRIQNKDAFEAFYRVYENFACDKGSALCRFDGVTATVTASVYAD